MKYMNLITKIISLSAIIIGLVAYQNIAVNHAALAAEREAEIEEVEAYNAEILAAQNAGPSYKDGTYEGTGEGFGGDIVVSVKISDGKITSVDVISHDDEDDAYFEQASALTEKIVSRQSTDLDAVSGATFSSNGILDAVDDALSQAEEA